MVIDENRLAPTRDWLGVARRVQDIPSKMPEDALWHDAVFSIARVSYVVFISVALDERIIPDIEKYVSLATNSFMADNSRLAPNTALSEETKKLSSYFKEEDYQAISKMLHTLHVGAFRTTVSDSLEAKDVVSLLAQVAALLWHIVSVLSIINDLSDNSAVKQALVDLQRELDREIDSVDTVFDLSKIGLAW
jgi:hypothetical protein